MFKTDATVRTLKTIAMVAGLAITLWSLGLPYTQFAGASNLTLVSDTLSDSTPNSVADHTIEFTSTSGVAAGETIEITFATEFATGSVDFTDIDLDINGVPASLAATPSGSTWGAVITGSTLVLTSGTGVVGVGETVEVRIGLNAVDGVAGDAQFTNPSVADTYDITITAGDGVDPDTGATIVVILAPVVVEAAVDTRFTFLVEGVDAGVSVNGDTTTATSTDINIPFGVLEPDVTSMLAHLLTVNTNASNGYVVTVQVDGPLESTSGDTIPSFLEGSDTNVPAAWALTSSPNIALPNTWAHWGITSSDNDTIRGDEFGSNEYIAASTTPRVVASYDDPTDGSGNGQGNTYIGFKAVVSDLQPAGSDYQTNLIYVATPIF